MSCNLRALHSKHLSYSATFKEHLSNPRNVGELTDATVIAEEVNPVCGDRLRLSLLIRDDRIESAKYLAYGCPPTLVSGSILTEMVIGQSVEKALTFERSELIERLGGLPSRKHHAAALAIETLRRALANL